MTKILDPKKSYPWECPFCGGHATITEEIETYVRTVIKESEYSSFEKQMYIANKAIVCPNKKCREIVLESSLVWVDRQGGGRGSIIVTSNHWLLRPDSKSKPQPACVPEQIREDYYEACSILDKSPKAAATLCRRALQGMIRDFWEITDKYTLKQEIDALKDRIDSTTWQAIDAVRNIGNIGAHMEKDVDLIINVEPGEAEKLIQLLEFLFKEWYVHREERQQNLNEIIKIADEKKEEKG